MHAGVFARLRERAAARLGAGLVLATLAAGACAATPRTVMSARDDFDARAMTAPALSGPVRGSEASAAGGPFHGEPRASLSLGEPGRFFMQQSYSLSAVSGPQGSASSGLYLNTLNYRFTPLMTAFVDVGFHTPIHSTLPGAGLDQGGGLGSLVVPRMGLEYRPSERLSFNVELVNGPDAWKAWGASPSGSTGSSSRLTPGSRTP